MDWANEEYVKVYRRETDDDLVLTWQARALWAAMMVKFDRAGLLETRRGIRGLAALVRIPLDVVQAVLPELLDDGRVLEVPLGYFSPNFLAAQEASKSDKLRQRDSRARRAALAKNSALLLRGDVTNRDRTSRELAAGDEPDPGLALPLGNEIDPSDLNVTNRDEPITDRDQGSRQAVTIRDQTSRAVTASHAASHAVTLSSADPDPDPDPDPEDLPPARTIPSTTYSAPVPAVPAESAWNRRQRWWRAMLDADARIKANGIEPNAPPLPAVAAGTNERNLATCERQLAEAGYSADDVDAKMLHIVLVAEAEALRERHRKWFKPALIWDPERAARAADTTLDEARAQRMPPKGSAERAPEQPARRKLMTIKT